MCYATSLQPILGAWDFSLGPWAMVVYGLITFLFLAGFVLAILHLVRTPLPEEPDRDAQGGASAGSPWGSPMTKRPPGTVTQSSSAP